MNTKVPLTIVLVLIAATLFSQNNIITKIDTTVLNESISTNFNSYSLQKNAENKIEPYKLPEFKGHFNDSIQQLIPKKVDTLLFSLTPPSQNNMPVIIPKGEFNMPVMVPDTTIDFKLKIQGIESGK